jgi:hypothetical protein
MRAVANPVVALVVAVCLIAIPLHAYASAEAGEVSEGGVPGLGYSDPGPEPDSGGSGNMEVDETHFQSDGGVTAPWDTYQQVIPFSEPFAPFAAPTNHPIPTSVFRNILWFNAFPSSTDLPNPTPNHDFVIVRVSPPIPDTSFNYYTYNVYFCKESDVYLDDYGYWRTHTGISVPAITFRSDDARIWEHYPEYIGYQPRSNQTMTSSLGAIYFKVSKADFPFIRVAKPGDKPDPPEPPKPPVPPIVIPPHNPDMVPWAVSKMLDFYTYVSTAMGHIVNVGLRYFAIILAVYVMIRIIKNFENQSAGGGGDSV